MTSISFPYIRKNIKSFLIQSPQICPDLPRSLRVAPRSQAAYSEMGNRLSRPFSGLWCTGSELNSFVLRTLHQSRAQRGGEGQLWGVTERARSLESKSWLCLLLAGIVFKSSKLRFTHPDHTKAMVR